MKSMKCGQRRVKSLTVWLPFSVLLAEVKTNKTLDGIAGMFVFEMGELLL
jgi:hypothetical protein